MVTKNPRVQLTIGAPLPSAFRELCGWLGINLLGEHSRGHLALDGVSQIRFITKEEIADSGTDTTEDEDGVIYTSGVFQFDVPELRGHYFATGILQKENTIDAVKHTPPHLVI